MSNIVIAQQDSTIYMDSLEDQSFDLILTSPPYNAGKEYESILNLEQYRKFAKSWVKHIPRILKSTGNFWLNVGYMKTGINTTLPLTYLYFNEIQNLQFIQEIVWHYEGGMSYKHRFTHRTERWMWYAKDAINRTFNLDSVRDMTLNRTQDKRNNPLGKNPTDYWYFDRVTSGTGKSKEKTIHPCQFPVEMIERIIKACSNPGDTVFDPFMGSGSTAIACINTGRNFVGVEKDYQYVCAAEERINKILLPTKKAVIYGNSNL